MQTKKTRGVLFVLSASIMWALEPLFARFSYEKTDFLNTFATRTIFALLIIAGYLFITEPKLFLVQKKYWSKLIYISLVATLFADLMYIFALTKVPVINAVLIGHMQPIFIILLGFFILKQDRINKFDYWGIVCMIIAGVLVTSKTFEHLIDLRLGTIGDLYVLLATIAWATTAIIARKYLLLVPAGVIAFYRFFFAGLIFVLYMIIFRGGIKIFSIFQVLLGIVIGLGTIFYYEGIRVLKAAQVSALELSTPFFAAGLAFIFLKEGLTFIQIIGIILLTCGIYFLSRHES